ARRKECEPHILHPHVDRLIEAKAPKQRFLGSPLHRSLASSSEHDHRLNDLGPIRRKRASYALPKGVTNHHNRIAAERFDYRRVIRGKVMQREIGHRSRTFANPSRLRTYSGEASRDETARQIIKIRCAAA